MSLLKSLNFVACAPTFTDVHVISTAMADLLVDVLGPARGIGARATIGVQSLAANHCYESWFAGHASRPPRRGFPVLRRSPLCMPSLPTLSSSGSALQICKAG